MTDVALALPLADEQRLVADAPRHGHRVVARSASSEQLAVVIGASGAEYAVVAASAPYLSSRLIAACDGSGVRLLVVAGSAHEERFAASLGVVDPVAAPFVWELLAGVRPAATGIRSAAAASPVVPATPGETGAVEPGAIEPDAVDADAVDEETRVRLVQTLPSRGTVIAVWGPEGAPGRTSLAIALAAELAAASDAVVALADADTRAAAVAPALGLLDEAPGFAAACRLAGAGALDRPQFDRIAQTVRSGRGELRVLTGIGRASRWPELSSERIAGVLRAVRDWAHITVVDVASPFELDEELMTDLNAPRRNAATLEVLRSADRVIAVGAADPVGLSRFLRGHAEIVELIGPERITVVVNKVRAGAIGMDAASQVRQTLSRFGGIEHPVLVPWDPSAFDAALLGGRPLLEAAPRSHARQAIRALASALVPAPVA